MLLNFLYKNKTITNLKLDDNVDNSWMEGLGKLIASNKVIQNISMGRYQHETSINDQGIAILCPYIQGNTTLRGLSFRSNTEVTNLSIAVIADAVRNSRIDRLNVHGTGITLSDDFLTPVAANQILNGHDSLDLPAK